jgi:hypothetical protein
MQLLKAVVPTGRQPAMWKQVSMVIICTPGTNDNMTPNAYCSIPLLCCMGKVVEEVVAE